MNSSIYIFLLPSQARGFSVIASHNIKLLIRITVYPIFASGNHILLLLNEKLTILTVIRSTFFFNS